MLTLLKVLLSIPIGIGIAYPFFHPEVSGGILGELKILGPVWGPIGVVAFLLIVRLYVLDLIRSLELVAPSSRKAKPGSVWFMFLLPYNFIEDFFIVANVAKSLKAEAAINPALAGYTSFGMVSGLGWCIAQVVSLVPNEIGSVAGLLTTGFWIWHWVFIRRTNRFLAQPSAGPTAAAHQPDKHS